MKPNTREQIPPSDYSVTGADPSWKDLYRAGAISAAVCAVLYVAALVVVMVTPMPPTSGGAATLGYIAAHRSVYILEQVLWLAPSLFAIIVFLALYPALKHLNKSYAAIGTVVGVASWAISLAYPATGGGAPALVYLSDQYTAVTTAAEHAGLAAAAEALIAQNTIPTASGVGAALGVLLVSLLMVKGVFHKGTAYLGIATGAIGIVSEALKPVLGWAYALYGVLILLWFAAMAWELYRLSRRSQTRTALEDLAPVAGPGARTGALD
jgi:hypothetical protein